MSEMSTVKRARKKGYTVFGKFYATLDEVTQAYGITYTIMHRYLPKGYTVEEVIKRALSKEVITFEGKEYATLIALCKAYKVNSSIVSNRINRGFSLREAVLKSVRKRQCTNSFTFRGVTYESKRDFSDREGIHYDLIRKKAKSYDLTYLEVLTCLVDVIELNTAGRPEMISMLPYATLNGVWYNSLDEILLKLGLRYTQYMAFQSGDKLLREKGMHHKLLEMQRKTVMAYTDTLTGERVSQDSARDIYGAYVKTLLSRGTLTRKRVPKYPTLHATDLSTFIDVRLCLEQRIQTLKENSVDLVNSNQHEQSNLKGDQLTNDNSPNA